VAAGPTFIFPTASSSRLGQDKWQWARRCVWLHGRVVSDRRIPAAVVVRRRTREQGIALLTVLGGRAPAHVTVNELTTVASAFTDGDAPIVDLHFRTLG
jgi:hypothetical protein